LFVTAVSVLVGLTVIPAALSQAAATSPTCTTVSSAIVNATMGGGAMLVGSGGGNGALTCDYGGTHNVNIHYITHQTAAMFKAVTAGGPGYTGGKTVHGIGASAYYAIYVTAKPAIQYLFVLDGQYIVEITGSKTTLDAEEALVRKVLPLI
jgi:hypothetical protein